MAHISMSLKDTSLLLQESLSPVVFVTLNQLCIETLMI